MSFLKSITNNVSPPTAYTIGYHLAISVLAAAHLQQGPKCWALDAAQRDREDAQKPDARWARTVLCLLSQHAQTTASSQLLKTITQKQKISVRCYTYIFSRHGVNYSSSQLSSPPPPHALLFLLGISLFAKRLIVHTEKIWHTTGAL